MLRIILSLAEAVKEKPYVMQHYRYTVEPQYDPVAICPNIFRHAGTGHPADWRLII